MRPAIFLFFAAYTVPCLAGSEEPITLTNEHLRIGFDRQNGQLVQFEAGDQGHDFVGVGQTAALWDAIFQRENGTPLPLNSSQAKKFEARAISSNALTLTWSEFESPDLSVAVTVELGAKASRWRISMTNLGSLRLRQVRFPIVPNIPEQPEEHLAVPVWMGQLAPNPRQNLFGKKDRLLEWDYPGHTSMQSLAFYGSRSGLLLSCDDTNSYRKSFAFWTTAEGALNAGIIHLPESQTQTGYAMPYHAVLGTFRGDWVAAAEQYRSWATNQWWAAQSRVATRVVPQWARQTALWVWNRGESQPVLEPAALLKESLGLPVSVFWHWWHGCPYDVGFPEYLPPREGTLSFIQAVEKAHNRGLHTIVYMNQRLWGMSTESWKSMGAERYAVKGPDGKVRPEIYNTFTKAPCASMCIATPFWRNTYADLAEEAVKKLGVDGIYMDQACSSLACYDPAHGHPIGGGKYWMNGFRLLSADIRGRSAPSQLGRSRDPIGLAGEGVGESWLPYLDLMLSLQVSRERYAGPDGWEPIPFFQAVYHPYSIQYGNYASLTMPPYDELWPVDFAPRQPLQLLDRKFSRQFYLEQGRAFVWGQQPTLANFRPSHLTERAEEIEFVLDLARLRAKALKYMADGVFVGGHALESGEQTIDMSRLSIYAGQKGGITEFQKTVPKILSATWRSPQGDVGVAMVNITDEPLKVQLPLNGVLSFVPKNVFLLTARSRERLSENLLMRVRDPRSVAQPLSVQLQPRQAVLVEVNRPPD